MICGETAPDVGKTQTWQTRNTVTKLPTIARVDEEAEETESDGGEDGLGEDNILNC